MNISFENKRVLVTGAGRGIGHAAVKAFVRGKAAKVFAVSRTKSYLDELVAEVPSIIPIIADLTDIEAAKKVIRSIGPIDILVNNAGRCDLFDFLAVTPEDYKKEFDTNFQTVITVSQIIIDGMIKRKEGGCIVNVSSRMSFRGGSKYSLYAASKAALDSLTRTMAVEFGSYNIRVNSINPGVVKTDMSKHVHADENTLVEYCSRIPLGRVCGMTMDKKFLTIEKYTRTPEVEDVVNAIVFFASDASRMINGHSLPIEGGNLIMS